MGYVTVIFNKTEGINVYVDDHCFVYACSLFGFKGTDFDEQVATIKKECVATAMLLNAGYMCTRPAQENASYDLIIQGGGLDKFTLRRIDIKTEYVSAWDVYISPTGDGNYTDEDHLQNSITAAINKENRDGNTCAFDISYLTYAQKLFARTFIGERAIIIEYELDGSVLKIHDPYETAGFVFYLIRR
jgi:hypothetical protein